MPAQLYNCVYRVEVSSSIHGVRGVWLVPARSSTEAIEVLGSMIEPWSEDRDTELTVLCMDKDTFIFISEKAFGETKQ